MVEDEREQRSLGDGEQRGPTLQEWVYRQLRHAIMCGHFVPGHAVTMRGVARMLDVSPMPVREALRRLVAEGALALLPNRRVAVPAMPPARFDELCSARIALETVAAERALPGIDADRLARLRDIDAQLDEAIARDDVEGYMLKNLEFHQSLYSAVPSQVLLPLIEGLWLQFGPFMRHVLTKYRSGPYIDRHKEATEAIAARDGYALRVAIEADIRDGAGALGREAFLAASRDVAE